MRRQICIVNIGNNAYKMLGYNLFQQFFRISSIIRKELLPAPQLNKFQV